MSSEKKETTSGSFHLNKWFLDFVGDNGEAMIFYAAKLRWHGWSTHYTSWLHYDKISGVNLKSRFRHVQMPELKDNMVIWGDSKFGVSGTWKPLTGMLEARLFDSLDGYLDWHCYQPASEVELVIKDKIYKGKGYAEQLILTAPPWKIPMDELRWGRFGSDKNNIVWIELREKDKRHWLWLNGEKIGDCIIEDDHILLPGKNLVLNLDRSVILESEKKIFSVVEKLIRYIPGFNRVMPLKFLMANEIKWLSKGRLLTGEKTVSDGMSIHELVSFKIT